MEVDFHLAFARRACTYARVMYVCRCRQACANFRFDKHDSLASREPFNGIPVLLKIEILNFNARNSRISDRVVRIPCAFAENAIAFFFFSRPTSARRNKTADPKTKKQKFPWLSISDSIESRMSDPRGNGIVAPNWIVSQMWLFVSRCHIRNRNTIRLSFYQIMCINASDSVSMHRCP